MTDINVVKERVIEELKKQGIDVYFIDFYVIVSGRPKKHVRCVNACEIAEYYYEDGWYFDAYPEWEDPQVTHWIPLPERPEDCHD